MVSFMVQHTNYRSHITLPLLVDYIQVLLPSLIADQQASSIAYRAEDTDKKSQLLWVVQDEDAKLVLQKQLKESRSKEKRSSEYSSKLDETSDKDTTKNPTPWANAPCLSLLELLRDTHPTRYELVCFWLPDVAKDLFSQYIPLLMRYRDLYAAHLLIAVNSVIELRAYGFTPFNVLEQTLLDSDELPQNTHSLLSQSNLWQFNLYDYKQLPNWLNSDYWANPENWDKHRW